MKNGKQGQSPLPDRTATKKLYAELRPEYELLLYNIYQQMHTLAEEEGLSLTLKYRVKGFDSYCEKLVRLHKLQGSEMLQITDLLGLRIVCPFLEELEIIEKLIAQKFEILEMEHKAEQHSFSEFGYDSVHLLIKTPSFAGKERLPHSCDVCEIQLRTILQDAWAEVEHELVYKSDIGMPNHSIRRKLASLNASLTLSDLIFQEIRDYQKEIRQRGLKCRQEVETISCGYHSIDIAQLPDVDDGGGDKEIPIPEHLSSDKLEKLMFGALEAHSNNRFRKAINLYSAALKIKLDPAIRSLVYNHRGMALFALAEYNKGLEDFNKSIEYNNENARAWTNRGLAYRVLEKFDLSLENYDRVIAMNPQQYEGYWGRAQTCFEMKLFSRALNDCHKTIERKADFTPALELEKALRRQLF
ncbi:putative GTP pyrophosphokinase [Desulfuromusa kysingii]|uniref:Putative GTP pyrophosphokinase n=1 Tax=Desulfuromusa kysingii TaxID=37625 RepID=A0A1H4AXK7_9BACT|nr:tetratricopeptide repeat protein [Desulfuromusa kysingii]SEA40576.1 putative GTP pyrophosphokinase [Desulfuromusa kysingii]